MIASPLRPRYRQESGIAAAGRLAHQGTPYSASLSFATTTHLWPLPDPPSRKLRSAQPAALEPPGQFRAAPLPRQCWIPPIRAPGQDFHLRSQHPYPAHPLGPSRYGPGPRRPARLASYLPISEHQHQQQPTPGGATSSHRAGASASHRFHSPVCTARAERSPTNVATTPPRPAKSGAEPRPIRPASPAAKTPKSCGFHSQQQSGATVTAPCSRRSTCGSRTGYPYVPNA